MASKINTPVKSATAPAVAPVKRERVPVLPYSVFAKLAAGSGISVAGIVRKSRVKVSSTGEAQVFIGEFAHRIDGGEIVSTGRAVFPANIAAGFPSVILKPHAFSFVFKDKTGQFVRTPSIFSVAVLLP